MGSANDPNRAGERYGMLIILAAASLWGTSGVVAQFLYGGAEISPLAVGFYRLLVASILVLLEPLTATVLAGLFFGERLGAVGVIGGGLLLSAILILYAGRSREPSAATST